MAIEVFGAGAVQSAYVSYLPLDITANSITLLWPTSYVNAPYTDPVSGTHYNILAASMDVTTPNANTHGVTLPDATMSSVGSNFIITNVGLSPFNLHTSDTIVRETINTGISCWVQLTDNSTPTGIWTVITFGAGISQATAAGLAGNGLVPLGTTLNTNSPIVLTNPTAITNAHRANLIVWTGGPNTLTLPAIGTVSPPSGYYVSFNNQSSQIAIQPNPADVGATIDGKASIAVELQQSLTIITDGANWWTLGFGQNQFALTSSSTLTVPNAATYTLTDIQASSLIQNYEGALLQNITIFFPITTNYWFINNNTSGAFTLSVQLAGSTGAAYVVPQGTKQIFYSNSDPIVGFTMFPIPTPILPVGVAESILVFRGGNWIALLPGLEGSSLKISGGLVAWV